MQDALYIPKKKTIKAWKALLSEAKEKSFQHWCDILDCSKSFCRKSTDKTFDEILEMLHDNRFLHTCFIHRKERSGFDADGRTEYIEVGLSVSPKNEGVDYFIFIYVDISHLQHFIDKYGMESL